jgi:transketolase
LTATAKKVVEKVREWHSRVGRVNVSTLKPFDDEELFDKMANVRVVVTVVNHWVTSGLGRVVEQVLAKRRSLAQLVNVALADVFTLGVSAAYLEDC